MTNERAIELLHRLQDEQFDGIHGDERREALEMAVRALSGDGDTIYRQDAIDACCFGITHARVINVETGVAVDLFTESNKELHKAIERIEALPPAQPEVAKGTNVPNNDCISRQAAIDALQEKVFHNLSDEFYGTMQVLNELPPAQPERKKGKWIWDDEAYPGGNPYGHYDCDQCGESVPHKTNYCPLCGADMRGESE